MGKTAQVSISHGKLKVAAFTAPS